ncbi:GAF-domain-containing sensor protein [Candidatus Magnetoovum chiemensis]|nr:GAF-domain-containing sensor protein [Candidatus Magnetoovum chiemensis]
MGKELIPVCGWCKKIKEDNNNWQTIEQYLISQGYKDITHGMCPECSEKIFQKRVYLESYQNIAKAISSSLSLDEVLSLIVTNVVNVMNVKGALLRLVNKRSNTLDVAAHYGLSQEYVNKGTVVIDRSIEDALAGKTVSIYDVKDDEDTQYFKEANKEGIRTIVSIPLRFKDEIIGVLRMYTAEPRIYTNEDLQFVSAIAEQAAIAIMKAKEFETIVSKEKEFLKLFREISKAVSSTLNIQEVLNIIVENTAKAMRVKGASIRLIQENTKKLVLGAVYGLSEKYQAKGPVDEELEILRKANFQPIPIYDTAKDPRILYKKQTIEEGVKSVLIVPIKYRDKIIGILKLLSGWFKEFKEDEIEFAVALAEQCALAIENAMMYEKKYKEARYLKTIQELTKLMTKSSNLNEVLKLIVNKITEIMSIKAATIRLVETQNKPLKIAASYGLSEEYLKRGDVSSEENIKLALKGEPVAIYDATSDMRIIYNKEAQKEGIKSILVVPLVYAEKIIGILRLLTDEHRHFEQDEIAFAMAVAEGAAIAVENTKAQNIKRYE